MPNREYVGILVIAILSVSAFSLSRGIVTHGLEEPLSTQTGIHFLKQIEALADDVPAVIRFSEELNDEVIFELRNLGIRFSFGTPSLSSVGPYFLVRGTSESLKTIIARGLVSEIKLQTNTDHLHSARDVSIPETDADRIWSHLD
ncbi:MAG: hypothetical protein ACFFD9_10325, partial [Candidatus Thorarchaeota archaeon]